MTKYPKINSIFKRGEKGRFLLGEYSRPEFEYLKDNIWVFTEKIHGTNIRVIWYPEGTDGLYFGKIPEVDILEFKGRTDKAQIIPFLYDKLQDLFCREEFRRLYPETPMILYGEGYGARIQKGGGNYIPDGVNFILFDVKIGKYWLKREDIEDIAKKLGIDVVPIIGEGTLHQAIEMCKLGFNSVYGDFLAEGIVLRPKEDILMQSGARVITKVKYKDFKWERRDAQKLQKIIESRDFIITDDSVIVSVVGKWWLISDSDTQSILKELEEAIKFSKKSGRKSTLSWLERIEHILISGLHTTNAVPDDFKEIN